MLPCWLQQAIIIHICPEERSRQVVGALYVDGEPLCRRFKYGAGLAMCCLLYRCGSVVRMDPSEPAITINREIIMLWWPKGDALRRARKRIG